MIRSAFLERQLPHGVADLYLEDAALKTEVEVQLQQTFSQWSYTQVIPPTFEYYEALAAEASPQVREEIYRFSDRDGRMLALRADPTIPIARLAATKLVDHPLPLRFFYIANVFRYEEPKASLRREFTQAGVELIGAGTPQADAEGVALAVTALRSVGLPDFRVRLGAMDVVNALVDELGCTETQFERLKSALERKNRRALDDLLGTLAARPALRQALSQLPQLAGGHAVLDQAQHVLAVNARAAAAVSRLTDTWRYLTALGVDNAVTLDLAMVRGMTYYTGVVFEGFARGIGFAIMSGGRYDRLLAHFGRELPALGFAIGVERLMAVLQAQGRRAPRLAPDVIAELSAAPGANERVLDVRAAGKRVELSLESRGRAELIEYARARGASQVWFADGSREALI